ncbi:MAG: (deoxy)nucleoside triphosphate pyrophosphohydrolase [Clostridia bacterium]|nr:(deoxy)nucleoside triphosphate pyrophosphohydrolase [Clostridia bacterium]
MTKVVAALIWQSGRFLICRRPAHKTRGLLWEFVGGKVENGETKQQALIRECKEELAVTVRVDDLYMKVVHPYPDMTVELSLFNAAITDGTPQLLEHCEIRWITPDEIDRFDFCPADVEILAKLKADYAQVKSAPPAPTSK